MANIKRTKTSQRLRRIKRSVKSRIQLRHRAKSYPKNSDGKKKTTQNHRARAKAIQESPLKIKREKGELKE